MAQEFDWVVPLKRIEEQLAPWRVKTSPLLPPVDQGNKRRKKSKPTLVLEVIGTLVRAKSFDESGEAMLGFTKRPWLDDFLKLVSERYEVVAFTRSLQALADEILDWLDPERCIFSGRLYRQHCSKMMVTTIQHGGEVKDVMEVKDLERLGRELKRVVLVDHNLLSAAKHMSQGIQVRRFSHGAADDKDDELQRVWTVLQRLETKANVVLELAKMKKEEAETEQGDKSGSSNNGDEQPSSPEELAAAKVDPVNGQKQEDKRVEKQGGYRGEVAAANDETKTTKEAEKFCVVVPEEWGSHLNCNQDGS